MKLFPPLSVASVCVTGITGVLAATGVRERNAFPTQLPSALPIKGKSSSAGCWKSGANMTVDESVEHLASGECLSACTPKGYNIAGLHMGKCLCGYVLPPWHDHEEDLNKFNSPCPYFPAEACGGFSGPTYWTIWYTGKSVNVKHYSPSEHSSAASSASSTSSKSSKSAKTIEFFTFTWSNVDGPWPTDVSHIPSPTPTSATTQLNSASTPTRDVSDTTKSQLPSAVPTITNSRGSRILSGIGGIIVGMGIVLLAA